MNKVWIICQTDFTTSGHVKLIKAYSNQTRANEDLSLITSLGQGPEYVLQEMDLIGEVSQLYFKPGMLGLDTSCQEGASLQEKQNPARLSGANGMKCGDRVLYPSPSGLKYGTAGEFTQDGDCYVMFDDAHVSVPVKWSQLELVQYVTAPGTCVKDIYILDHVTYERDGNIFHGTVRGIAHDGYCIVVFDNGYTGWAENLHYTKLKLAENTDG